MKLIKSIYRFLSPKHQTIFLDYKVDFKPRYGHGNGPAHKGLNDIVSSLDSNYSSLIDDVISFKSEIQSIEKSGRNVSDSLSPKWNNDFLPGLDIAVLYTLIAKFKPEQYIEVGSGNSTKVVGLAKRNKGLNTKIISVDPQPRAEIDELSDEIHRVPAENLKAFSIVERLNPGDILFIDNSHRCLPNSDATVFFLEVLPKLKKGVIVHIHDVYLPFDYPQFMCDRAYSEQYMLAMAILSNPKRYKTLMPNYYVSQNNSLADRLNSLWDHSNLTGVEKHGGSYWLEIGE